MTLIQGNHLPVILTFSRHKEIKAKNVKELDNGANCNNITIIYAGEEMITVWIMIAMPM